MTRFDIPDEVARMMDAAIESKLIDRLDLYALASDHGDDWERLADDLCNIAFKARHADGGRQHAAIVTLAEAVWRMQP